MDVSVSRLTDEVEVIAGEWRADHARTHQARRYLDAEDFARLRNNAGFLHVAVPRGSRRAVAQRRRDDAADRQGARTLAAADPSVALVASMHPAVLAFWLAKPDPGREAWTQQTPRPSAPRPPTSCGGSRSTVGAGLQWWLHAAHQVARPAFFSAACGRLHPRHKLSRDGGGLGGCGALSSLPFRGFSCARHAIVRAGDGAVRIVRLASDLVRSMSPPGPARRRDRAPPQPVGGRGADGLRRCCHASTGIPLAQPEGEHRRVHRGDECHRWVGRGQRPEHLADRPRRLGDAAPQPLGFLRNGDVQEPGVVEPGEVLGMENPTAPGAGAVRPPLAGDDLDRIRQAPENDTSISTVPPRGHCADVGRQHPQHHRRRSRERHRDHDARLVRRAVDDRPDERRADEPAEPGGGYSAPRTPPSPTVPNRPAVTAGARAMNPP